MDFCKEFNARTAHIEPGVPIPTMIHVQPDRTFTLSQKHLQPPTCSSRSPGWKKAPRVPDMKSWAPSASNTCTKSPKLKYEMTTSSTSSWSRSRALSLVPQELWDFRSRR
ncbi:hypothetical protein L210DRAFT_3521290, partial [Boletus edulis BED1]